jgi:putative heme-binding domain-containing protein
MMLLSVPALADQSEFEVREVILFGDMECFKIRTPHATYFYGKRGAGLASLLDADGNDWISYRHGGKAQGEYRGLPKCGQPVKYFHCGYGFGQYATSNIFTSTIEVDKPGHIRIKSVTQQQDAEGAWDFYPTHATFTLLRIPTDRYWFLYEGTPGGRLDTDAQSGHDVAIRPNGLRTPLGEPWKQVVPWVAFDAVESQSSLFLVNHQPSSLVDSYVAWPYKASASEPLHQMTVFGFGRPDWQDPAQHTPPPGPLPAVFSIGFTHETEPSNIVTHLTQLGLIGQRGTQQVIAANERYTNDAQTRRRFEQAALTSPGDALAGKKLFFDQARTKCANCHRVGDQGGSVGPALTQIGGKFDRPHLIESLLEPSRQIVEGYRTTRLLLSSGEVVSGIIKERSEERIRLLDAAGKVIEVESTRVEQENIGDISLMPEGVATGISLQEFTDLIAYLESLRGDKEKMGSGTIGPIRLPEGFQVQTVVTGMTGAVALETLPDGRILICEQTGGLRVIKDGQLLVKPFVELPVHVEWERGLIGVTVDPNFPEQPYVYVCYVAKDPYPHHVVSRLIADGDTARPGSEQILLRGDDQRQLGGKVPAGHQGGALHFGPDRCLYIGIGEQTAGLPAQKLDTFQGKLLRIHADGSIPTDNPFYDSTEGKYRAIWAYGLRNPFTFAFHPRTGDLLINDVGGEFEEINRGQAAANYGWPTIDHGPTQDPQYVGPIHVYPQSSIGGGLFVPEGSPWAKKYHGKYLFADFVQGWIGSIDPQVADAVTTNAAETFATGLRRPVDMRLGADGSLYVLLRNAWVIDDKFEPGTSSLLRISSLLPR